MLVLEEEQRLPVPGAIERMLLNYALQGPLAALRCD